MEMVNSRLDRIEQLAAENRDMILLNRAAIRENHTLLLAIGDSLGITYKPPESDS